ncbi:MAG: cation transporter [Actinomycetia bacterium]|nr:cation transporter [Actinomycetes bacterium]
MIELSPPTTGVIRDVRQRAVRQAWVLNIATIGWNTIEGAVALAAGIVAGSVSLVGFGMDSAIEVSAALILTWRLRQERRGVCTQPADARATKAIALSFAALATYVAVDATTDLLNGTKPEASTIGLALAAVSLLVMPLLARAKARLAPLLGSAAAKADAAQTNLCALLSAVVLIGIGANWALGWWWADPLAGLAIAAFAAVEAVRTWRAESLADTCCA